VAEWLEEWFGWPRANIIDLGGIITARGTEMTLPLWVSLMGALGTVTFNWRVVRAMVPAS
jgi:8-hydroxy-5-deazaflavin:NADPH oxidoreductase